MKPHKRGMFSRIKSLLSKEARLERQADARAKIIIKNLGIKTEPIPLPKSLLRPVEDKAVGLHSMNAAEICRYVENYQTISPSYDALMFLCDFLKKQNNKEAIPESSFTVANRMITKMKTRSLPGYDIADRIWTLIENGKLPQKS